MCLVQLQKAYLDTREFDVNGIRVVWKDYSGYPEYPQLYPPFEHAVTILDLLFHTGQSATQYIWGWRGPGVKLWRQSADECVAWPKILSIAVPVFQNETDFHTTIPTLMGLAPILNGYQLELVMVDDGSRDRSYEILMSYAEKYPANITVVKLTRNFGQVPAIQAGLRHASGDCVGIISADLQEPWEALIEMVHVWERGGKFIIGERLERAERWWHRTVSGIYWYLVRRFAFPDYPTMGYDFCLLDRQIVKELNRINEKNTSIFVLAYWLGYKPVRVPIKRCLRERGKSQWSFSPKGWIYHRHAYWIYLSSGKIYHGNGFCHRARKCVVSLFCVGAVVPVGNGTVGLDDSDRPSHAVGRQHSRRDRNPQRVPAPHS